MTRLSSYFLPTLKEAPSDAEAVSHKEDRAVAERMKAHADTMVKSVDKLAALFR